MPHSKFHCKSTENKIQISLPAHDTWSKLCIQIYTVIFTPRHAFYNANNPLYPITTIALVTKSVTYIKRLLALKHHATLGKVIHHDEQASIRRIIIKKEYSIPNRLKKWMGRKLKPTWIWLQKYFTICTKTRNLNSYFPLTLKKPQTLLKWIRSTTTFK